MRVAVTGAGGFTGRYVVAALQKRGIDCIPLSADLTDAEAVEREIAAATFNRLIHLAAKAFVGTADWEGFYQVNQIGTFRLLEAVTRYHPGSRCLIASSAQVYGPGAEGLIEESTATNPANHYAVSKLAMEQGAALWGDDLEIVVVRPFNYSGIGQSSDYLISKIVEHFHRSEKVIELGNTWVKRDFGDVRAVADAYVGLILAEEVPTTVNVATGEVWTIDEILEMLSAISGHKMAVRVNPAFVRANDVPLLGGDVSRLQAALPDWRPRELMETLSWMYLRTGESETQST